MYAIRHHTTSETIHCRQQIIRTKRKDMIPVYQTLCTFEGSRKGDEMTNVMFGRSPLISSCVPDVYSPGSNGKCSPPPPSSHLPPPPFEWL